MNVYFQCSSWCILRWCGWTERFSLCRARVDNYGDDFCAPADFQQGIIVAGLFWGCVGSQKSMRDARFNVLCDLFLLCHSLTLRQVQFQLIHAFISVKTKMTHKKGLYWIIWSWNIKMPDYVFFAYFRLLACFVWLQRCWCGLLISIILRIPLLKTNR